MHLTKRNSTYYIRCRVPLDVQKFFPYPEIKRSLGTGNYRQAKTLAAVILGKLSEVCTMARTGLTDEMIQRVVQQYLDSSMLLHDKGINQEVTTPENTEWHERFANVTTTTEEGEKLWFSAIDAIQSHRRKMLGKGRAVENFDTKEAADFFCRKLGLDESVVDTPEYRRLCKELLQADIRADDIKREHLQGNFETDYDKEVRARPKSDKLSDAIEAFKGLKKKVKARAAKKYLETLDKITECLEYETGKRDILLSDLDYSLTKRLVDRLAKYPLYRHTRHKGQTLDEAYKTPGVEYPSPALLDGDLSRLGALYKLALSKFDGLKKDYMEGIKAAVVPDEKRRDSDYRDIFRTADLQEVVKELLRLKAKGDFEKNPHLLLIPLIAMFQGLRVNEICQLRVADIMKVDGLWCISVNEDQADELKSVKNTNSIRLNPIHPKLQELGLLKFYQKQKAEGMVRLWEGEGKISCAPFDKAGNHSHYFSKWANGTFKKKLNLSNPEKQTFHSFRHTFINWFRQNLKLVEHGEAVTALSGHLDKDDVKSLQGQGWDMKAEAFKTYAKGLNVGRQYDTLKLLSYDIDLSGLAI